MVKHWSRSFFSLFVGLATLIGVVVACSSGSSPTEPSSPSGSSAPDISSQSLDGGADPASVDGPAIDIEKSTNGADADLPPGPTIPVGDPVKWTYVVTNIGNVALKQITVSDDQVGIIDCPRKKLDSKDSMTCTASGKSVKGQYSNQAKVTSRDPDDNRVSDSDSSHYNGGGKGFAAIDIEKSTNGVDADFPRGPVIAVGDAVLWTYRVTNIGDVALTGVSVTDNQGVKVTCEATSLVSLGKFFDCSASGTALAGQYVNEGRVTALDPEKREVTDTDSSHYFGSEPEISIEKRTEGESADDASGPRLYEGCTVEWTYEVINKGNIELKNIVVTDDQGEDVDCSKTTLPEGGSMTCFASGIVVIGQYSNKGTVEAVDPIDTKVSASDPSHYLGVTPPPPNCSTAIAQPDSLWPPNHSMDSVTVDEVVNVCGSPANITVTSIRQDEPVNNLGDGDTAPDGTGIGTSTAQIRAERSGTENGRVYQIGFTASDGFGGSCEGVVKVGVPHDRHDTPIDDGPDFDSTQG